MEFDHISKGCGHCVWNFVCQAEVNLSYELYPSTQGKQQA